ncbi:hypothetical protein AOXY_G22673 [Acipenser oxyrinchus oxyrinchus]|uniref:Uncharacterized protein n=1 Tax=Acipenser oxyrinchus oxyrinchus TaxID=40147 RepID=A0AAD8CY81_ACIOX|nr:hypothetical protein AOXY_G22673 [Acipenser oxyrinchus oxyrinchus]
MSTLKTTFSQPPSTPPSAHNNNGCAESNGNLLSPNNVCRKTFTRKDALRCPKDVYGQPSTYRWKTEYDQAYNLNDDGTWKRETL